MTSAFAAICLKISTPFGVLRLSVMLRLLRCRFWKSGPWRGPPMSCSIPAGSSILMTSAPQSASCRAAVGPARTRVRSSTLKRESAADAGVNDILFPLDLWSVYQRDLPCIEVEPGGLADREFVERRGGDLQPKRPIARRDNIVPMFAEIGPFENGDLNRCNAAIRAIAQQPHAMGTYRERGLAPEAGASRDQAIGNFDAVEHDEIAVAIAFHDVGAADEACDKSRPRPVVERVR